MSERVVIILISVCFALIAFGPLEFSSFPSLSRKGSTLPGYDAMNRQVQSSAGSKADKQRNEAFKRLVVSFSFFAVLSVTLSAAWYILTFDEEEEQRVLYLRGHFVHARQLRSLMDLRDELLLNRSLIYRHQRLLEIQHTRSLTAQKSGG